MLNTCWPIQDIQDCSTPKSEVEAAGQLLPVYTLSMVYYGMEYPYGQFGGQLS